MVQYIGEASRTDLKDFERLTGSLKCEKVFSSVLFECLRMFTLSNVFSGLFQVFAGLCPTMHCPRQASIHPSLTACTVSMFGASGWG